MELSLFDEVADVLRGLIPPELGVLRTRARRYGIKVWFGPEKPPREHYEAQVVGAAYVEQARVLALEVGFHLEHPAPGDNDEALGRLVAVEKRWRKAVGPEAVIGPFLGHPDAWRRISEVWPDPDLSDPELGFELAARLTDYVLALEPVRSVRS